MMYRKHFGVEGEPQIAVVVPRAGHELAAEDVTRFCRDRLAGFKTPRYVVIADGLPKNPSGKLLKLNPFEYADAHYNNAVANYFLKNYDDAEKSFREARKLEKAARGSVRATRMHQSAKRA